MAWFSKQDPYAGSIFNQNECDEFDYGEGEKLEADDEYCLCGEHIGPKRLRCSRCEYRLAHYERRKQHIKRGHSGK